MKVNLASGRRYLDGYTNVDNLSMNPNAKVDVVADIRKFNLPKNSVDEIFLNHFMMYLTPSVALRLFKRWYRWLKDGGKLIIETSDSKKLAKMIIDNPLMVEQMFGYGDTAGHKWSYCEETLVSLLIDQVGFSHVEIVDGGTHERPDRDITVTCTK
jgi:predicted SAM-dependent methyltransferase